MDNTGSVDDIETGEGTYDPNEQIWLRGRHTIT